MNNIEVIINEILPDIKNFDFAIARQKLKHHLDQEHHKDIEDLYHVLACINNCDAFLTQSWRWEVAPVMHTMFNSFSNMSMFTESMKLRTKLLKQMRSICMKYCKDA